MSSCGPEGRAGFGSFELVWALLVFMTFTVAFRFGARLLGNELGWPGSALLGVIVPLVLLAIVGGIMSTREPVPGETNEEERTKSTSRRLEEPCVRLVYDEPRRRRVRIFLRDTGTFYFQEEHLREEASEWFWIPVPGARIGFYDSEETALREARASIDWL